MLFLLILCFGTAFLVTALLVRYARGHTERYGSAVPQRFHTGHVPRIGGIGMLAGCTAGWAWMLGTQWLSPGAPIPPLEFETVGGLWLICCVAVGAGALEDLTQRFSAG